MASFDLLFANALLRTTLTSKREQGYKPGKLTVYKYDGFSRNGYHTYQVYEEKDERAKVLGDFGGYYAAEAKAAALNMHYPDIDDAAA